jgi:hypothetical protein
VELYLYIRIHVWRSCRGLGQIYLYLFDVGDICAVREWYQQNVHRFSENLRATSEVLGTMILACRKIRPEDVQCWGDPWTWALSGASCCVRVTLQIAGTTVKNSTLVSTARRCLAMNILRHFFTLKVDVMRTVTAPRGVFVSTGMLFPHSGELLWRRKQYDVPKVLKLWTGYTASHSVVTSAITPYLPWFHYCLYSSHGDPGVVIANLFTHQS